MFNFNKEWFIDKVKKRGIQIVEYGENAFTFPLLFEELSELTVSCVYDVNSETIIISASTPISDKAMKQTVSALCDRLNSLAKFHTFVQGDLIASSAQMNMSMIDYTDDNDALEYLVTFILFFKQEFYNYGLKAFQYANTGNINYLR